MIRLLSCAYMLHLVEAINRKHEVVPRAHQETKGSDGNREHALSLLKNEPLLAGCQIQQLI